MFEKEAKERARDYTSNKERQIAYECGFLDGADRMKEEIRKLEEDNDRLSKLSNMQDETIVDLTKTRKQCKERIEQLEKENKKLKEENADFKQSLDWANERESENCKCIEELEQKISVLLSCKNCPENKGGYICKKEQENKCLSQKIQYIKELKEDNKVMADNYSKMEQKFYDNLSEAKVIIKDLLDNSDEYAKQRASDFLKEE